MEDFYEERLSRIVEILIQKRRVRVASLSDFLEVSKSTIRRDLNRLSALGKIQRVHGGALVVEKPVDEPPALLRKQENSIEKQIIGALAARMITEGECVFIGSGTTSLEVALNLVGRKNLTVVTNSLMVANVLAKEDRISLVLLGGIMRHSELSFIGHITEQALKEIRMDKAFMGIPGISLKAGLTNDYLPEVMTDRTIISIANELILLADHTKFGKIYSAFVSELSRVSTIVTDPKTDPSIIERIKSLGIEVIIANY
jgi:DeoR/GlpR family transcriptional regulator of sugar metabolism